MTTHAMIHDMRSVVRRLLRMSKQREKLLVAMLAEERAACAAQSTVLAALDTLDAAIEAAGVAK